jgi:uncharacterized membrane protein YjjB (DUF3815 family)
MDISTIAFNVISDPDRSRVRYEGSSGAAPRLQRLLLHRTPAGVFSIAAAAHRGGTVGLVISSERDDRR